MTPPTTIELEKRAKRQYKRIASIQKAMRVEVAKLKRTLRSPTVVIQKATKALRG